MSVQAFYDELAPLYHLIFENCDCNPKVQTRPQRRCTTGRNIRGAGQMCCVLSVSRRARATGADQWESLPS